VRKRENTSGKVWQKTYQNKSEHGKARIHASRHTRLHGNITK